MREHMEKLLYEHPELDIRWFEAEDICSNSIIIDDAGGDGVVDDDDW